MISCISSPFWDITRTWIESLTSWGPPYLTHFTGISHIALNLYLYDIVCILIRFLYLFWCTKEQYLQLVNIFSTICMNIWTFHFWIEGSTFSYVIYNVLYSCQLLAESIHRLSIAVDTRCRWVGLRRLCCCFDAPW